MVAELIRGADSAHDADDTAPSWHIAVAPLRREGLVEARVTAGDTEATILLSPEAARLLAEDLRRMADAVEGR